MDHVVGREYAFISSTCWNRRAFILACHASFGNMGALELTVADFHQLLMLLCPDFPKAREVQSHEHERCVASTLSHRSTAFARTSHHIPPAAADAAALPRLTCPPEAPVDAVVHLLPRALFTDAKIRFSVRGGSEPAVVVSSRDRPCRFATGRAALFRTTGRARFGLTRPRETLGSAGTHDRRRPSSDVCVWPWLVVSQTPTPLLTRPRTVAGRGLPSRRKQAGLIVTAASLSHHHQPQVLATAFFVHWRYVDFFRDLDVAFRQQQQQQPSGGGGAGGGGSGAANDDGSDAVDGGAVGGGAPKKQGSHKPTHMTVGDLAEHVRDWSRNPQRQSSIVEWHFVEVVRQ